MAFSELYGSSYLPVLSSRYCCGASLLAESSKLNLSSTKVFEQFGEIRFPIVGKRKRCSVIRAKSS